MMTGFHKYTIFVFVVLANFTPLFNLFGGPLSFHHAIDVQRLCREDLYTPSFGNFQDKLKVRAAEKSQAYDARRGVSVRKSLLLTQLLLLGKFEYTGGPIFKVVLEC